MRTSLTLCLLGVLTWAVPAPAQQVHGHVLDVESNAPIEGAEIRLFRTGSEKVITGVTSDSTGFFRLTTPGEGEYTLQVRRIGFNTVTSDPISAQPERLLLLSIRLSTEPLQLAPIEVVVESSLQNSRLAEFYDRKARMEARGTGRFFTRDDIEQLSPAYVTDVLQRVFGFRRVRNRNGKGTTLQMTRRCPPIVYLNGYRMRMPLEQLPISFVGAIEVYRPQEAADGYFDPTGCGMVLIWTR